ncbi:hypothetical protein QTP88_016367 [Uroleucon formosanum]
MVLFFSERDVLLVDSGGHRGSIKGPELEYNGYPILLLLCGVKRSNDNSWAGLYHWAVAIKQCTHSQQRAEEPRAGLKGFAYTMPCVGLGETCVGGAVRTGGEGETRPRYYVEFWTQ